MTSIMIKDMKLQIKNFKSLQDVSINLKTFNILVGTNGSGKTNVLELFKFMSRCTNSDSTPAYPFAPWWKFNNIVWSQNERLLISASIRYDIAGHNVKYSATISGAGGNLQFINEELNISEYIHIMRDVGSVRYILDEKFQQRYREEIREIKRSYKSKSSMFLDEPVVMKIPHSISILNTVHSWDNFSDKFDVISLYLPQSDKSDLSVVSPMLYGDKNYSLYMHATCLFEEPHLEMFENGFVLLRDLNYDMLHNPVQIGNPKSIQEDGSGLINMLCDWHLGRRMPRRIVRALEELFPGWSIGFGQTADGRILMHVNDGHYTLNPPSIPDGFYKMLAILTAIETRPRFLLIDELENSLHSKIIEYLLDELATCESIVIITTHSPLIIDLIDLSDLVLLDISDGKTVCKKVQNPDELMRRLSEKGITPSEQWIYDHL